jgi:cytochrome b561/polyisoprenoid-binding protein YceI
MALVNTTDRFGTVAKTLHWLTALLIFTLLPLGLIANDLADQVRAAPSPSSDLVARTAWLFSLHKTLGVAAFFVALVRILWALGQPRPGLLHPDRKLESFVAETVHWLLYGALVLVPLSGWITHAATAGFAPIWWPLGQELPLVPKSETVAAFFGGAHRVLTKLLALALVLHIAGALKHHLIDRDATLRRMWFGHVEAPSTHRMRGHIGPVATAFSIWAIAMTAGAVFGVYTLQENRITSAALEEMASQWRVQDGSLTISVTQFGSTVTGPFSDWTAAITFDETVEQGQAGTVDVTIAITSLTLGSVTAQAMGPDFFDATSFPTARFVAGIFPITDGYEARGTLTIKGRNVPLAMPFGLSVNGDAASMTGSVTLDRRAFGIGNNMADESALKFAVIVDVDLTAARGDGG